MSGSITKLQADLDVQVGAAIDAKVKLLVEQLQDEADTIRARIFQQLAQYFCLRCGAVPVGDYCARCD